MEDFKNFFMPLREAAIAVLGEHNDYRRICDREWTSQGFGMIRTYLDPDKVWRLNVWHDLFKVPGVSVIHDHPWHFDSWVLSGAFRNQRYHFYPHTDDSASATHSYFTIRTGIEHNPATDRGEVHRAILDSFLTDELYGPGDYYHQDAEEIHQTIYSNFCVTINRRTRVGTGEHARVFWPVNEAWVDAKPRKVEYGEISHILDRARRNMEA